MSQTATRPKRPQGSRPPPSHSSSSSSSSLSSRSAITADNQSLFPSSLQVPASNGSTNGTHLEAHDIPQQPPSRSVTPKPKLPSLRTGGGVAASIGAHDPDQVDPADTELLLKQVSKPAGPPISIPYGVATRPAPPPPNVPSRESSYNESPDSQRPSLRPPPIGGGKHRALLMKVAIPVGSSPIGAIGADEPDAISLLQASDSAKSLLTTSYTSSSSKQTLGLPQTPLNLGGDEGDVTVRPALLQGHAYKNSMDMIKETLSPPQSSASQNDDDWAEAEEYLEDVKRLGEGAGGEVYMVRDRRTDVRLARKIIQARTTPPKQLVRELRYLKDTGHPNIIKFFGAYISPSSSEVKVIMEYCEGGSLEAIGEKIKQGKGRVGEAVAGKIAEGMFNGLAHLHSKKIIHRDIKPSNVLVSRNGIIKLCDFGVSGELVDSVATTWTGTSMYMAPERIQGGQYTIRSDVWSSGLTLLTLAQNRFPYPDDLIGIIELINYITKEEIPQLKDEEPDENGHGEVRWSDEMKDFINVCLTREEASRPIPREMIQHPWLLESATRKVPMALWIRDVWDWEKKERGRPSSRTHSSSGSGSIPGSALSPTGNDEEGLGRRRPSAVRLSPRDSSQVRKEDA